MREIVAGELQRVGFVARGYQGKLGILLEGAHDVAHFPVDARRQRRLGKARPDRRRYVRRRRARFDFADRSIGQLDRKHLGHDGLRLLKETVAAIDGGGGVSRKRGESCKASLTQ
jgi:hypothetical protein